MKTYRKFKKAIILFIVIVLIPIFGFTQSIEHLDYISPIHDGFAAIKKDGQWAFINANGDMVVSFRNDLVTTKLDQGSYPVFVENRCLIQEKKDGISYFGYIDPSGKTIIEPQFLNATNFNNGNAIVLELVKEITGRNAALKKDIVYYKYFETIIDKNGEIKRYLNPPGVNIVLDREFLREPPKINSKRLSDNLYAILNKNKKWSLITIKN
ncbi:WG repeat-containing protein [Psychroserpens luteus]|uniref:WG repeat-containing protein n=1 Tax=Psychroserpens luteus TaxID=1434066 RepID=A0ABW5ZTS4_9FLAO|nr:WG repeat-containing protein [Psychroserpens luteus]